ncbi:serine/threonine-protein kinase [Amycolatopsis sp. H20-H5]|uniref:serine/threonine-protein kinase n=1 Tax=Amycolatopsis sp. H20-H5 TaxID=3046309 RepID=UPI003FA3853A
MGTVWSAYDEFLHRPVAVKEMRMPPGVPAAQADELRERTLREARAIAVLSHPNVIILHDVARENDEPFVVMELLPSRSLAHILRDHGPLTVEQAAAVGSAVAGALEAAHAAGITHRDVKPGNVLVAGDGRIKLTDFGIARNVSEATMTRTGMMLGSPAYIAPEVASGGAVTSAADLWGLGATLFAAVEGHPPYDADGDPLETVGKVVNGKVPKPKPGPLAEVIGALMKKEPGKRLTLRAVRHKLYPLQAETPHDLFGPELFHTPDGKKTSAHLDATDTQVIEIVAPAMKAEASSSELAVDPGPLPFLSASTRSSQVAPVPVDALPMPTVRPLAAGRQGRGFAATAVLVVASILVFLIAAGGGFYLARTVGGQSLAPPEAQPDGISASPPPPPLLVQARGDASNVNGIKGGQFTLDVPFGWQKFVAPHQTRLGSSTVVQYVSTDGQQVIRVERFANYFTGPRRLNDYLSWVQSASTASTYIPFGNEEKLTGRSGIRVSYRTIERASDGTQPQGSSDSSPDSVRRTTYADLFQEGSSLWVLSVTAPTEQETTARTYVFERIEPKLTVLD